MSRGARASAAALFVVVALGAAAAAETPAERAAFVERALNNLERAERAAASAGAVGADDTLRRAMAQARDLLPPIEAEIARLDESLAALGPAPKADDPPESEALATERAALEQRLGELRGQRTRLVASIDDASAALARLSRAELERRYAGLLVQETPLLAPSLWRNAATETRAFIDRNADFLDAWRRADRGPALNLLLVAAAALVSLLLFGPASTAVRRAAAAPLERLEPTRERRLALAGVKILSRLLPGLAGGFVVIESARATGLLGGAGLDLARAFWAALIGWLVAQGFLAGLFASANPAWRLSPVGADRARWIAILALGGIAVFSVKIVLVAAIAATGGAPAFSLAAQGSAAALIGMLIIALSRRTLWFATRDGGGQDRWSFLRRAARVVGAALIAAAIAGYIRFADFAASRLYYGALLIAVAWAARASLKQGAAILDKRLRKDADGAASSGERRASLYWIGFSIDALLLFALAPAALALIGWSLESAGDMTARAFAGIRIGGAVISISDMLVAVLAFAGVVAATRIVQTALQRGPLAYSRIDRGVQDSLITLIGYAGIIVAAVVGVSILGVNLSNLALIAGALSVGVGLGLQGVVNNFVSGLILLFERPIKVGDWIVTGAGQGVVKKISVRSTEIETFEKSSIIVPNSELITQPVTNLTHRGTMARQLVQVAVALDADPRRVYDILLNAAREHPLVLVDPGPFVNWRTIGPTALEFELGVFIADVARGLDIRNDLRFAILKALRAADIPFPRQDVHVHRAASALPGAAP